MSSSFGIGLADLKPVEKEMSAASNERKKNYNVCIKLRYVYKLDRSAYSLLTSRYSILFVNCLYLARVMRLNGDVKS